MKAIFISWDWAEQPDWEDIDVALQKFQNPTVVHVDDTGCDSIVVMIAERPQTAEDAQTAYDEWVQGD